MNVFHIRKLNKNHFLKNILKLANSKNQFNQKYIVQFNKKMLCNKILFK